MKSKTLLFLGLLLALPALYLSWNLYDERQLFTPEEFEEGMAKKLRTVQDWAAHIADHSSAKYWGEGASLFIEHVEKWSASAS